MAINVCMLSASTGKPYSEVGVKQTTVLLSCLVVGSTISWWDGSLSGILAAVLLCLPIALAEHLGQFFDHPAVLLVAAVAGLLIHRSPMLVGVMSLLVTVLASLFHPKFLLEFTLPVVGIAAIRWTLGNMVKRLGFPFVGAAIGSKPLSTIVAFALGYLLLTAFFALLYTSLDYSTPDGAFQVSVPREARSGIASNDKAFAERQKLTYSVSSYFSLQTISSSGSVEIVPKTSAARLLVSLETFTGMLWFTVYLALLLRSMGGFRSDT